MKRFFLALILFGSCVGAAYADTLPAGERLDAGMAERFARLALACIDREFPNKPDHVLDSAADARVPREFHPAFFRCFDWHSSVHGHWMLVRLLKTFPDLASRKEIRARLAAHFTPEAGAAEARYLEIKSNKSFARTAGPGRCAWRRSSEPGTTRTVRPGAPTSIRSSGRSPRG